MKRIALLFIVVLSLLSSGCSTTRKTTTTNTQAEAQLTATTQQEHHAEATEKAAIITNVTTDERRNVVIDFTTVEFYLGGVPSLPSDTTAPDWLNAVVAAAATEDGEKAKPPNVKSITKGRAVIEGEKNEQSRTEAQADRSTTEDDAVKEDIKADAKEATDTKTEEKPKFTFWDWLYIAVVGGFSIYAIIVGVRITTKLHRAAKGKDNGPG